MRPTHQVSLVKTEFAHVDQSVHKLYEFGKSFKSDHVDWVVALSLILFT